MDTMKQNANIVYCKDKRGHIILAEKIELKPLVVLLENCLEDVPKRDKKPDKVCKEDLSSSSISTGELPLTLQTMIVEVEPFICYNSEAVSTLDTNASGSEEDSALNSDLIEPATQTLSLSESLLLHLPIPSTFDDDQMAKCGMVEDDSVLSWEKLAEPLICEARTPLTSGNSSVADLDLTPPSSVASRRSLFEDRSTSFDDRCTLECDILPKETDKVEGDKVNVTDNNYICKELRVEIVHLEPTIRQLQVLHRQNKFSKTHRDRCLRPKSSLKQFVPFMFEQAENNQIRDQDRRKKRAKTEQSTKVFHSTPKPKDAVGVNKKIKEENNNTKTKATNKLLIYKTCKRKQLRKSVKQKQAYEKRQLKLALKQKESSEKKQLKLALKEKKEALKHRNKFVNSLDSINRRICNQNAFWRTLPL